MTLWFTASPWDQLSFHLTYLVVVSVNRVGTSCSAATLFFVPFPLLRHVCTVSIGQLMSVLVLYNHHRNVLELTKFGGHAKSLIFFQTSYLDTLKCIKMQDNLKRLLLGVIAMVYVTKARG